MPCNTLAKGYDRMRLVAVVALLIAPATCWRGSARHTRHRDLKDLLLQRAVQTQLAQFHEQCAPPDEESAASVYPSTCMA